MTRRFCVMTTGRSGSTSLMYALEHCADVLVPNKHVPCPDNELVHPDYMGGYLTFYTERCGRPITSGPELIDGFFDAAGEHRYAGFKSMPDRHPDLEDFIRRADIQFIGLKRLDVESTVASFITAFDRGTWRRSGGPQEHRWRFGDHHHERIRGHLRYLVTSFSVIDRIPGAISLSFEDLCTPGFSDSALDAFFDRPMAIEDPRPPTSGEQYVENWTEFSDFVHAQRALIEADLSSESTTRDPS